MEHERKLFAEEAQAQLKRHKALIDKLQRENDHMREDLHIAAVVKDGNGSTQTKGSSTAAKAQANAQQCALVAAEEIRIIKEKLEEEKSQQERMEEDIKTLQQDIIDQKRRYKGVNGA